MSPSPASGEPQPEPAQPYTLKQDGSHDYILAVDGDPRTWLLTLAVPADTEQRYWLVFCSNRVRGLLDYLGRFESRDAALEAALKDQRM